MRTLAERHLAPYRRHPRYFRDVNDHLIRVREQIGGFDELLTSILQACLARVTMTENETCGGSRRGRDRGGAHGHRRHLRHELQPHARAALGVRLPMVMALIFRDLPAALPGFRRNGWL